MVPAADKSLSDIGNASARQVGGGNSIVPLADSWRITDRFKGVQVKRTIGMFLIGVALKMGWGPVR